MKTTPLRVILAKPRGFCAGVERAIRCVERTLELYGKPVYVLRDIVHNAAVVDGLREQGAVFVKSLDDVPHDAPVLFSAHGVAPGVWDQAHERGLHVIDATCPLVDKVHREAKRLAEEGYTIILIGEKGHDEVIGTIGWATGHIHVILSEDELANLRINQPEKIAYLTQTTLCVQECARLSDMLKSRFPSIESPPSEDICYATQNRQRAVNDLAPQADLVLVVGDQASANSKRLAEICQRDAKASHLIPCAEAIEDTWFDKVDSVLVTSGASVPESLVQGVVAHLQTLRPCTIEEHAIVEEAIHFSLPEAVR
ncbi:MAG: 4-hydroxy-3-methylbut-2-enyl diphosphate reductase [Nitrospiraceae bacterium]|nr:4-hydroxy-3-methylbut-2-enyl diphosphate reductase [Nitrospiraceae bacterium]